MIFVMMAVSLCVVNVPFVLLGDLGDIGGCQR
jgi:hypothetical protein